MITKDEKPDALTSYQNARARLPIFSGEPIVEKKVVEPGQNGFMSAILPKGMRAVSVGVSERSTAGGFILPNDRVDVILTRRDREAEKRTGSDVHRAEIILSDIRVLAIDQTVQEKDGQRVVVGKTATLELAPRQAETLALSRQLGTLSLALRSLADANKATPETPENDGAQGSREVNMVRYGVSITTMPR